MRVIAINANGDLGYFPETDAEKALLAKASALHDKTGDAQVAADIIEAVLVDVPPAVSPVVKLAFTKVNGDESRSSVEVDVADVQDVRPEAKGCSFLVRGESERVHVMERVEDVEVQCDFHKVAKPPVLEAAEALEVGAEVIP